MKGISLLSILTNTFIGILIIAVLAFLSANLNKDQYELKEAEKLIRELTDLRIAIDKYYNLTGSLPNLTLESASSDLGIIRDKDETGRIVSFYDIYGKNEIPSTPEISGIKKSNKVIDSNNFSEADKNGGWYYDYSGGTGELHVNLPDNVFDQGVDWINY